MNKPSEELTAIQTWMQSSLIDPVVNKDRGRIDHYVAPSATLTAEQRLAIYQRSYYSRLLECMHSQFKALHYTLGKELFDDFARNYLRTYPSSSPGLASLGERFPAFLQETRPDKNNREKWVDFMIAMAQFECDLYRIFDQKGSEGEEFANENTPDKELLLQACFTLCQYPFPVNQYYQEVADGNAPEIPGEEKIYVAFVRVSYRVFIISLTEIQYAFLECVSKGVSVENAKAEMVRQFNLVPGKVAERWLEWKKEWIGKGFFLLSGQRLHHGK